MKKSILTITLIIVLQIFMVGCSNSFNNGITESKENDGITSIEGNDTITKSEENEVKEIVDLVLSYKNGYDETMEKHISEKNFYVCNYVEFYSLYIGDLTLNKYESEIVSLRKDQDRYIACMLLNIEAKSLETHGDEQEGDEAIGENVPVELILKERNGELYIESFKEYENIEKAKELNDGFK